MAFVNLFAPAAGTTTAWRSRVAPTAPRLGPIVRSSMISIGAASEPSTWLGGPDATGNGTIPTPEKSPVWFYRERTVGVHFDSLDLVCALDFYWLNATLADVADNPRKLKLIELDAAQLPRSLDDVAASTVTLNYAVLAGLKPQTSITLENEHSKWHLVWAARKDRKDDPRLKRFIALYRSAETKAFINSKFEGTIIPTW